MHVHTIAPTMDGLGSEAQSIEVVRNAGGHLVLGTQPVRCISIRDHCCWSNWPPMTCWTKRATRRSVTRWMCCDR